MHHSLKFRFGDTGRKRPAKPNLKTSSAKFFSAVIIVCVVVKKPLLKKSKQVEVATQDRVAREFVTRRLKNVLNEAPLIKTFWKKTKYMLDGISFDRMSKIALFQLERMILDL